MGPASPTGAASPGPMTLSRLKWAFLLMLAALLVVLKYARGLLEPYGDTPTAGILLDAVIVVSVVFFCGAAFTVLGKMQERLERRNRELLALHDAGLDIHSELSLDVVLRKVVDQACSLLDAKYGAVSVIDDTGEIREFVTSGISEEMRERIGSPPSGRGLLGVVLNEGQRLRLADFSRDPRASGLPEHHPPMHSLLAVPIVTKGPFRGNLYLSEKAHAHEFNEEDEESLARFATKAAIAIDNAHLHQRLRALAVAEERVRIAREMHDGMAQVLAYVNTKAQAVKEYLHQQRTADAEAQLEQLAAAAREVYVDVREDILGLRTDLRPGRSLEHALREFLGRWESQSGIAASLRVDGDVRLPPIVELQLLRIIQEALTNIRKHSRATRAEIEISQSDGKCLAQVTDDGAGFDPSAKHRADFPRFGLAIMRERAESIDGELVLSSEPGKGTRVRIAVPLAPTGS